MTKGQLDLTNQASIDAYKILSDVAGATNDSTTAADKAHKPWQAIRAEWARGREEFIGMADGMGLTTAQAKILADQLIKMPDTEIDVKARTKQAITDLNSVMEAYKKTPGKKIVNVETLSDEAMARLRAIGLKVEQLPDGSFTVSSNGKSQARIIALVEAAIRSLDGKKATTWIYTNVETRYSYSGKPPSSGASRHEQVGATGGLASSLKRRSFAHGGSISGGVLDGPGTKKSDSLFARLSRGEFVMQASAVDKYGPAYLQRINQGMEPAPGFAKGGKVSQSTKNARKDLASSFSISHFGRMAGYKTDSFEKSLGKPEGLSSLVSSLNSLRSEIKKAFSGGKESSLLKQLDKAGKSLIKYEKNLAKVEKSLEKAKAKLDDLKQAAASLRDSVKTGVMSATNITRVAGGDDKNITMVDIMDTMREGVDKSSAFSSALKRLQKKGVSKEIIGQIAEAGIAGGGLETAGALLTASSSEIKSVNDMQKKITDSAVSAGKTAADAMYGAGIKAAEGLVAGLTKKKKAIEKAMMNIAKAMEKAIKSALGIKSPSKVMEKVGHFTAQGFAVGVKKNRAIDNSWSSMLTTKPSTAGVPGGGGGNGAQVIQLVIGGKVVDEIILDSNRRTVRTRGGNVQAVYGR